MVRASIVAPTSLKVPRQDWLTVLGARHNNLKNIDVSIPLGRFVCITGVSGSGKSSLVNDILREKLVVELNEAEIAQPGAHDRIDGTEHLDKVIDIDQSPIGRTPRSNPATYIKLFDEIRDLYAKLPDSKVRGYAPGRFSFNVPSGEKAGGRCEACEGNGANRVEMDFLADVWVQCPVCQGKRFNRETLQILYKGNSIHDVLEMDVQQALAHFEPIPKVRTMLATLHDVGLDYLKLGQSSTTLSGGEAQRIKLARELVKRSTGRTLYLLDEPTTGLHFEDIRRLLAVLHGFVDVGNTVLVVEHNLDVIKTADWIIDLGPEGGEAGGYIVAEGTPEQVAACDNSYTGQSLRAVLGNGSGKVKKKRNSEWRIANSEKRKRSQHFAIRSSPFDIPAITVVGAKEHNLKDITVSIPRGAMTVCSGVSGSGKTSFAIDTVYTEGQRRYVESLSAYARQFLGQLQKPKVDHVHGLSPAIAIEQQAASKSPRSTVGTVTEIYDYMRVLWARVGEPHCPKCNLRIGTQTSDEIVDRVMATGEGSRWSLCAPVEPAQGETWPALLARSKSQGYIRARIDGEIVELTDNARIDAKRRHTVELVVDRIVVSAKSRGRIAESVEHCLALGQGVMVVAGESDGTRKQELRFSQHLSCEKCGTSYDELTPHHFSFNSRLGWCSRCEGLGVQRGTSDQAVIVKPGESILSGAIAGWDAVDKRPLLRAMLVALANSIGFDADTPVAKLTATHRHALLWGLGERWIDVAEQGRTDQNHARKGVPSAAPLAARRKNSRAVTPSQLRFQWKGFFPAIDEATRISWQYRYGMEEMVTDVPCQTCGGARIRPEPAAARLSGRTITDICAASLADAAEYFANLKLGRRQSKIAGELLHEIRSRLRFLLDVGLGYLSLGRAAPTLSGGESQRIRLASQIGSGLTGVLYVLDEPTIGLHPRDNDRLIAALHRLRDLGNTLLMVEHDREVIGSADHLIDFGPGAGAHGGHVVAEGAPKQVQKKSESLTGQYLSGKTAIPVPTNRRKAAANAEERQLVVHGARQNNLQGIDAAFPLSRFVCVTGVSGSGKSSLITEILYPALAARIHRARLTPGAYDEIRGLDFVDKVINVDQQPIGNSPLSSPATYSGVFDLVREVFAKLPDSKIRGYTVNRFSFNRPGGRCDDCEGLGQVCYEMHFLPDVWVPCETCGGKRYQRETLDVRYKGKNIAEILEMPVSEALAHFINVPKVRRLLQTLDDVGLGYLPLGQSAPTLSGGEAQRLKLAAELGRPSTGKTIYILDEPTTGLHFDDLRKLLDVLHRLVDLGNTVICIEHNFDVIKTADWVIDLGPEAGEEGGRIVAEGTPEDIAKVAASHTGRLLGPILKAGPHQARTVFDPKKAAAAALAQASVASPLPAVASPLVADEPIKMPWQRDGLRWHTKDRLSRDGKPVEWEGAALTFIVDYLERNGSARLLPTDWNDRARVEITAKAPPGLAQSATPWLAHFLTGGRWLLDVIFRVPNGTFSEKTLASRLALKTLDDRDDIEAYGQRARVSIRPAQQGMDQVRILVHDKKEISTPAFREFLARALVNYLHRVANLARDESKATPWKTDAKAWHLSQKSIPLTQNKLWRPLELIAFLGRAAKALPKLKVNWDAGKVFVELATNNNKRIGRIITHQGEALRVDLQVPPGRFTPTQVEHLGMQQEFGRRGSDRAELTFWFQSNDQVHAGQLAEVLRAAADSNAS
ncbi:MAG TPA: excinuclease ABC subunit UvrA [Phycisphaerae bacterium]|nr:excinuclease ABC subunit UvrA [Phycisphaerae bacterium]